MTEGDGHGLYTGTPMMRAAVPGVVSAKVAGLADGVLKTMLLTRVKFVTAVLLAVAVLGMGAGWLTHQALAERPTKEAGKGADRKDGTEVSGLVKAVDASGKTITLHPGKGFLEPQTFTLAGDARVFLDDGTGDKLGFQEGKLADLSEGAPVTLRLSEDRKVVRIWVEGLPSRAPSKRRMRARVRSPQASP